MTLRRGADGNSEVLYSGAEITVVDKARVAELKALSVRNERRRARLCAHPDQQDRLHEMLIVHERGAYVRPHRHPGKTESTHVIEGEVDVVIFDDAGGTTRVIEMGDYASGKSFYYRMDVPLFHTLLIRSERLVFLEATNGPFNRADTVFAAWAPDDADSLAAAGFITALNEEIRKLK